MKEHFICFDPGDLEEAYLPIYARRAKEQGQSSFEVKSLGKTIRLDTEQVLQIERDINSQTYARDFLLIEQADMIISFIPTTADGRAAICQRRRARAAARTRIGKGGFCYLAGKAEAFGFCDADRNKDFP